MVVISPVVNNTADTEELFENFEAADAAHPLRYYEPVGHLITGLVAFTAYPFSLMDKADGEASLSIHKTNYPAKPDQSFLLIARTGRIVTAHTLIVRTSTTGFTGFSSI